MKNSAQLGSQRILTFRSSYFMVADIFNVFEGKMPL